MSSMTPYHFQEGLLDTVSTRLKTIAVLQGHGGGELVGRVIRGRIDGCEKAGTFRWESALGGATELGVQRLTVRNPVNRLIRPLYTIVHGDQRWGLKDRWGENLLYFAMAGDVDGRQLLIRSGWDGSVEVRADSEAAEHATRGRDRLLLARIRSGDVFGKTRVEVDHGIVGPDRESATFGLLMLLPFMHRIYQQESSLIEELFG